MLLRSSKSSKFASSQLPHNAPFNLLSPPCALLPSCVPLPSLLASSPSPSLSTRPCLTCRRRRSRRRMSPDASHPTAKTESTVAP
eukprot:206307-Chlamydomonas_euryale.AAC.2